MPFNGSGTYTLPYNWNNDAANSINITASRMQGQDQDQATALSDCVTRDGQSAWTANLPAGGFKITGLANGSASTDSAALGQVFQIANNLSEGTAATMRTNLGLGTSATVNTGTSGATIPLLNGNNTYSGTSTFSAAITLSATTINKYTLTAPATAATLTIANNKTLTANNSLTLAGTDATTITFQGTDTYVGRATTDTLTNKTISGSSNTLSNIANASLSNMNSHTWKMNNTGSAAAPTDATTAQAITELRTATVLSAQAVYFTVSGGVVTQNYTLGGVSVSRTAQGIFSVTLGSGTLGIGMWKGNVTFNSVTNGVVIWCLTAGPMAALGTYVFHVNEITLGNVDPTDCWLEFF